MELKNKVEAILFSVGKGMDIEDMAKLCRTNSEEIRKRLLQLKEEYDAKGSLMLVEEGNVWKISVREKHLPVIKKLVPETELSKTMIETLAVIAWKSPVLQSDIIKVRTNKAYDHLDQLERMGFIAREKHGRTKKIKLTEKFYNYFDVKNEGDIKEKFKKFDLKEKAKEAEKPQEAQQDDVQEQMQEHDDYAEVKQLEKQQAVEKELKKIEEIIPKDEE